MAIGSISLQGYPLLLADAVQSLDSTFVDCGFHPRFGTRNFTLPLQNCQDVEVVCRLNHPAIEQTPWGNAASKKVQEGGGWLTWVFATEDISRVEKKFGCSAIEGHRKRPNVPFSVNGNLIGMNLEVCTNNVQISHEPILRHYPFRYRGIFTFAHLLSLALLRKRARLVGVLSRKQIH